MASWLSSLGESIKSSAEDLGRGIQGKETGRAESIVVTFDGSALGLTVSDHGSEGVISALAPNGEAERLGLKLGDRVVAVGGAPTFKCADVVDAIRSRPDRPLQLNLERRSAADSGLGLVTFRLDEECEKAEQILQKMLESPTTGPRRDVLARARGLAFLRVTKAGFAFSARFGTGIVVARLPRGGWSAPSAIGTIGASFGLQMGAQVADFLVVLNTDASLRAFSEGGSVSLGAQLGAVAGPIGASREASVAAQPSAAAPVFTYSLSRGLFAGVSLEGSSINERNSVNERHYQRAGVRASELLQGLVQPMPAARSLLGALDALDAADGAVLSPQAAPPAYAATNPFS